jgi:hypothetical protein
LAWAAGSPTVWVDSGVQRRRDPDDGGAGLDQLQHRLHLRPPGLVLKIDYGSEMAAAIDCF